MEGEFDALDDNDIIEIYMQLDISKLGVKCDGKKGSGDVDVTEMKKSLIERLPDYRSEIRNLPDEEIIKMYNDLQEEEMKSERKPETKQSKSQPVKGQIN